MVADDVIDPAALLPGDVVQDKATHKPLQIIGYDLRAAEQVGDVWKSKVNHEVYDIQPDEQVFECVYLPKGERIHVPDDIHRFPACRLERVQSEFPTDDYRVQAVVVRAVLAHLVADLRNRGYEKVADAVLTELNAMLPADYVRSITEMSEVVDYEVDDG